MMRPWWRADGWVRAMMRPWWRADGWVRAMMGPWWRADRWVRAMMGPWWRADGWTDRPKDWSVMGGTLETALWQENLSWLDLSPWECDQSDAVSDQDWTASGVTSSTRYCDFIKQSSWLHIPHIHYRSKVWGHLEMSLFKENHCFLSMKITLN